MVKSILTFKDIILYWNIFDLENREQDYYVYMNGEFLGKTSKTHYTVRDVLSKNNVIDIFTDDNKTNLFYHGEFTLPEKKNFIDISKAPYNAVGDGVTLNTLSIQKAIDDCTDNDCLYIPTGKFLTGAINLHSNMEVYIEKGGVLLGSENPLDYLPKEIGRYEGTEKEGYRSLINIGNIKNRDDLVCENILIHGGGEIIGGGKDLALNVIHREREMMAVFSEDEPIENLITVCGTDRPKLVGMGCSKNIIIDNLAMSNGAFWNIHFMYCDGIITCNSSIDSAGIWNGDGWNPDSSTNCVIFNCDFNTGDDCVAIKSGKNPEGNIIAKPSEDIYVFDVRCKDGHGITVGSEMSGGVENVYIWDCDIVHTIFGIEIKATKKRGGYVRNINVYNCKASRIMLHAVGYNTVGTPAKEPPKFSDCTFQKMVLFGEAREYGTTIISPCEAIVISGFGDGYETKNIKFDDIIIDNSKNSAEQTISLQSAKGITISNLSVK